MPKREKELLIVVIDFFKKELSRMRECFCFPQIKAQKPKKKSNTIEILLQNLII